MIGPFELLTTARSGERAGAGAAAWAVVSAGCFDEHPVSRAPMDAAKTPLPKSLRVSTDGASLFFATGPHVPQLVVWQSPQVLPMLPITLNEFCIGNPPLKKRSFAGADSRWRVGVRAKQHRQCLCGPCGTLRPLPWANPDLSAMHTIEVVRYRGWRELSLLSEKRRLRSNLQRITYLFCLGRDFVS